MTLSGFEATPSEEMDFERAKPAAAAPSPKPDLKPAPKQATAATLKWMREQLHAAEGEPGEAVVTEYFQAISGILPTETLADLPLNFVPTTKEALNALSACIGAFENGDEAVTPTYVDRVPADPQPKPDKFGMIDTSNRPPFMDIIVPVPRKGMKKAEYDQAPDTIGSLYDERHDDDEARKRLWGFANHYEPKGWTKRDGTVMPPSDGDIKFHKAIKAFAQWFKEAHPDEKL